MLLLILSTQIFSQNDSNLSNDSIVAVFHRKYGKSVKPRIERGMNDNNVSFIEKYKRGINSISAIKRYENCNKFNVDSSYSFYRNGKIYLVSFEPINLDNYGKSSDYHSGLRNVYLYCKDTSGNGNHEWIKANDIPIFTGYSYQNNGVNILEEFDDFDSDNLCADLSYMGTAITVVDGVAIITLRIVHVYGSNNADSRFCNFFVKIIR